jgi:hypothetical protein
VEAPGISARLRAKITLVPDSMTSHSTAEAQRDPRRVGGPLALTAVTLALISWPIAFNLGAYGEIFYDDIFRVTVASSVLFVISLVNPIYPSPWIWLVRLALASPMLWLVVAAWFEGSTSAALDRPAFVAWIVLILVGSVPLTLRLLVDLFMPELTTAASRKLVLSVVGIVSVVGVTGFVVGRENGRFLTCSDFAIAGSAEPDNCDKSSG